MYPIQPVNTSAHPKAPKLRNASEACVQARKLRNVPEIPSSPMHCINKVLPKEADSDAKALLEPASPCGADFYQLGKTACQPLKTYAYQNLYDWIARLFSRPGIEASLETIANLASEPFDPAFEATDIHHLMMWKQFLGPDGSQYTKNPDKLTFGIFMDGINPYGNKQSGKHASITFMVMPSLEQINWILRPIVEQLKVLWDTGLVLSQTHLKPQGRRIRAAILPFFANLPALRCALGFPGPTSTRMCSYCLLTKDEITNLKPETWPPRNLADHKEWVIKS
ncbi:uncharacterized protein PGTG_22604 [Puccinia graminis f. sp. tritici CRL 75-36-700-3]|uniref:Uncharacterized protein n=1 Tax=Puccinia graminis f. sp. tritici (strain CRL 75-36-700-3 / race SCCL) TaxID=418459 RepID=H6QV16_PUCGT|nr:uncharacterized protein PGTG_22604 [Puccinia graminis f. sp. tritici CRL 75-36-700-3]EHS62629.1 hypothetical protein PGTG_22604 [Puccinia graminis f. sp. tritici CRL 75-36-700-3]